MKNLGSILKYLRVFNKDKQLDISRDIEVSRSYISEIESGKKTPSLEILQRYSKLYNIPLSKIILYAENFKSINRAELEAKRLVIKTTVKFLDWVCKK